MGTARIGLALAVVASVAGVGCALLLGIDDKPIVTAKDASDVPPDPCHHATVPPAPDQDDDLLTPGRFVVAVRQLDFSGGDAGPVGFDLDGTCTCAQPTGAHDAAAPCTSKEPVCDDDGGVDNSFGGLAQLQALDKAPENDDVRCGRQTMLLLVVNYNGRANDKTVLLSPIISSGIDQPHETGETPSGCNDGGLTLVYSARWDGTDEWSTDTNFVARKTRDPYQYVEAYVRDWVLVARAKPDQVFGIPIGPAVLASHQTTIVANIMPLDDQLRPLPKAPDTKASFIQLEGQVASRVGATEVLKGFQNIWIKSAGGYVCPGQPEYEIYKGAVCSRLDLMEQSDRDFTGAACNAISAAISFVAQPARMQEAKEATDGATSPCGNVASTCD